MKRLAHEWKGTTRPQIALNHHDIIPHGHELNIERSRDVEPPCNRSTILLDLTNGTHVQLLRWQDDCGITTVHTCIFQMLPNGIIQYLSAIGNAVKFNLFCAKDELGHHHGLVVRDIGSQSEEIPELGLIARNAHGSTREHKAWTDKHRKPDPVRKLHGLIFRLQHRPRRLLQAHVVQHVRELSSILGAFDVPRGRSEDMNTGLRQRSREVVGNLTAHGHHHAGSTLPFVDIEYPFQTHLLEVETIALVVISGNRLGIVVDDDGLETVAAELSYARDGAPVELHRGSDAVRSAAEDDNASCLLFGHFRLTFLGYGDRGASHAIDFGLVLPFVGAVDDGGEAVWHVVLIAGVCHVEIVGVGGKFGREGIDLLDAGRHSEGLSECPHLKCSGIKGKVGVSRNLTITKPRNLERSHPIRPVLRKQLAKIATIHTSIPHTRNILKLAQKPLVDLCQIMDLIHTPSLLQRPLYTKQSGVSRSGNLLFQRNFVVCQSRTKALQPVQCRVDHATRFLNHLLEGPSNTHDLSHTQHGRSKLVAHAIKLLQIPPWHFQDAIIQTGLEARSGRLGDGIANTDQILPQAQLGRDIRQWIPRSLACQRTRSR
mmetsp:Transcript_29219/g.52928  ORF Transcript_29219/g.52928 Transcript_29219/m.52928 type:complete len:600 (+) Transcript_29219:826-2625(+)